MDDFAGHMSNYLVVVEKEGDSWRGSITFVQGRLVEGEKWENRKVEFVSVHKDKEVATGDLLLTFTSYLESCGGDLFNVKRGEINGEADSNEVTQ